jgi:hypothetical protein
MADKIIQQKQKLDKHNLNPSLAGDISATQAGTTRHPVPHQSFIYLFLLMKIELARSSLYPA